MAKELVEVKALRNGVCTPRISNSVKDKVYVTTAEEAEQLASGDSPAVKIIGKFDAEKAAKKKAPAKKS